MGRRFAAATVLAIALSTALWTLAACTGPADGLTEPEGTSIGITVPSTAPSGLTPSGPASASPTGSTRSPSPGVRPAASASVTGSPSSAPATGEPELSTPTAAAQHLYAAWEAGDEAVAELGATHTAVTELFAKTWTADTYFFGGCSTETECDYNFATGIIHMTVAPDDESGYIVTDVEFSTAG